MSHEILTIMEMLMFLASGFAISIAVLNFSRRFSKGLMMACLVTAIAGFPLTVLASALEKERITIGAWIIAVEMLYACICIILLWLTVRRIKYSLSNKSVVEALNSINMALCYFKDDGRVVLCNESMHQFSMMFVGHRVLNGQELLKSLEMCWKEEKQPGTYDIFEDQKSFRIKVRKLTISDTTMTEVSVVEVTDLYHKMQKLEENNQKMEAIHSHLSKYEDTMTELIREKEILNAKIRVHDEFGNLLLASRRAIQEQASKEELDDIVGKLASVLQIMQTKAEMGKEDLLEELEKTAILIGVEIHLEKEKLLDAKMRDICCIAIRECLTNTVKHADGHHLYVDIQDRIIRITNDGKVPDGEIALGTGLSSLEEKLKNMGAGMKLYSNPEFMMEIDIK